MDKYTKEVVQAQLNAEAAVMKELEKVYRAALDAINERIKLLQTGEITQSTIYHIEYQKTLKAQISAILDKLQADEYTSLEKYLTDNYNIGFAGSAYAMHGQGVPVLLPIDKNAVYKAIVTDTKLTHPLYKEIGLDMAKLKKTVTHEISRGIASGLNYKAMARNIQAAAKIPQDRAKAIARTDGHRVLEASAEDARQLAKARGADVVKQWDATMDGNTRDTHRQLDGQIRETNEPFTLGSKSAMYPGSFGIPEEDCNCRCIATTRARWELDEDELNILKERAAFFGLDKTNDFEEFKEKYLKASEDFPKENNSRKAAETLKKEGKSGIINSRGITPRTLPNGLRTSPMHILTEAEIKSVLNDAEKLKIPQSILRFNEKAQTGFYDDEGLIYIRGDILPDVQSKILRDNLSQKAVLAHEYYGHYLSHPSPFRIGDWRDEFMASYKASINAPNLTDEERRMLMLDAYDRAKEAGVTVKYNKKARELIYGHD